MTSLSELREIVKCLPTSLLILNLMDPSHLLEDVVSLDASRGGALAAAHEIVQILGDEIDARIPPRIDNPALRTAITEAMKGHE